MQTSLLAKKTNKQMNPDPKIDDLSNLVKKLVFSFFTKWVKKQKDPGFGFNGKRHKKATNHINVTTLMEFQI